MKRITVKLEGITPILFSRMTEEAAESAETGIRRPIVPGEDPREKAQKKLWVRDGQPGIPLHMMFACLVGAGRRVKNGRTNITGTRGTTLASFLRLKGSFFPFEGNPAWEPQKDMVIQTIRGQRAAHPETRPRFDEWSFAVEAEMDERQVAEETVKALFEEAGRQGLGAWRPSAPNNPGLYGQFRIAEWNGKKVESEGKAPKPRSRRGKRS